MLCNGCLKTYVMANIIITIIQKSQVSKCCLKTLQTKTDQQVNSSFFYSAGTKPSFGVCASVSINGIKLSCTMTREVFNSSTTCWSHDSSCPAELHPKMQQLGVGRWWSTQQKGSRSITHMDPGKSRQDPGFHKIHVCCGSRSAMHTLKK